MSEPELGADGTGRAVSGVVPPPGTRRPAPHGLIRPVAGRRLLGGFLIVAAAAVGLAALTTPLASPDGSSPSTPQAAAYLLGGTTEGLRPGDRAPEFVAAAADGTTFGLADLDGRPIRLADLRGRGVWINFWATWCPPCQAEAPVLRDTYERYRERGLSLVAVSVQELSAADVRAYAERYGLSYTIVADLAGEILRRYRVYALPTHFFVGPDGIIRSVVQGPLDVAAAARQVEAILP